MVSLTIWVVFIVIIYNYLEKLLRNVYIIDSFRNGAEGLIKREFSHFKRKN